MTALRIQCPPDPGHARRNAGTRHRWKVLAAGVVANAAFSVAFSGIPMTAVLMRSGYHLDGATLGLMLGMMGLGIAISELPWGLLTDRWGDRPVLLLGLGGTALVLGAMAWALAPTPGHVPAPAWLAAALVLVGLLGGSVNGASGRAIMQWFPAAERGLAMSIRQTAVPLGGAVGALLLPRLALHGGFAAVYGTLSGLCSVAVVLVLAWIRDPAPERNCAPAHAVAAAHGPGPLRDAQTWRLALGIGILCAPQFAVLSFGTVFLHDFARASLTASALALAAMQIGAMVLRVWSGRWTDRRRNRPAYLRACGSLSAALFAGLAAMAASVGQMARPGGGVLACAALLALMVVSGICVSAWHGVAYTELAVQAGAAHAGTALGMANTSVFVVCFLVPLAIPHLLALQGWPLVWGAAAGLAWMGRHLLAAGRLRPAPATMGR